MPSKDIYILAIESSCDETSAAVIHNGKVLSNHIATQKVHERYGGVVPELASRAHIQHILPVADAAISDAHITKPQLTAVGFTQSPGLIGSLLVGACFAKSFAQALNIPLIAVNHLQAHVLSHFIDAQPEFPFMCLTVSGGHTQIIICKSHLEHEIIGETIDDAAGEAFDKVAKTLGLPYPGGPLVDKYARTGDPFKYKFPMSEMQGYNFSFSGIKTAVMYFIRDQRLKDPDFTDKNMADICASVQYTIVKMLMTKLQKAAKDFGIKEIGIAGGVSANSGLRQAFNDAGVKHGWNTFIPAFQYCTDNAAMIGITAYYKYLENQFADLSTIPTARQV